MKLFRSKLFITAGILTALAIGGALNARAQVLANIFSARQITITVMPSISPIPAWTISQKVAQAKELLAEAKPGVFGDPITYKEQRFNGTEGNLTQHEREFKEPEKEIALAVLDTSTGDVKTIFIRKKGADLITPPGWQIEILQRPSGIRWNGWDTAYQLNQPQTYIVIGNVYPDEHDVKILQKNKAGKKIYITQRTIDYRYYVPYSPALHSSGLAQAGEAYIKDIVIKALTELKAAGVMSQAQPGTLLADVFGAHGDFFQRIPLLEQTDMTE